jgi:glutaredoxin
LEDISPVFLWHFVFDCLLFPVSRITLIEMEFIAPSAEGFTIYTKSNCPYCDKVKELFLHTVPAPIYVSCDAYLSSSRDAFLEFIRQYTGREHRTFPMVFWKENFIGGYTETSEYMNSNLFSADFTMNF